MNIQKRVTVKKKAFTLIELLVVISVIGILAALLLANFAGIRDRGEDASRKSNMRQLQSALRLYYNDNQAFPDTADVVSDLATFADGSLIAFTTNFVSYTQIDDDSYTACVALLNAADREQEQGAGNAALGRCTNDPITTVPRFCVCSL